MTVKKHAERNSNELVYCNLKVSIFVPLSRKEIVNYVYQRRKGKESLWPIRSGTTAGVFTSTRSE